MVDADIWKSVSTKVTIMGRRKADSMEFSRSMLDNRNEKKVLGAVLDVVSEKGVHPTVSDLLKGNLTVKQVLENIRSVASDENSEVIREISFQVTAEILNLGVLERYHGELEGSLVEIAKRTDDPMSVDAIHILSNSRNDIFEKELSNILPLERDTARVLEAMGITAKHKFTTPGAESHAKTLLGGMFYTSRISGNKEISQAAFRAKAKLDPPSALTQYIDATRSLNLEKCEKPESALTENEVLGMLESIRENMGVPKHHAAPAMLDRLMDEVMSGRLADNVPFTDAVQESVVSLVFNLSGAQTDNLYALSQFQPLEKAERMISSARELADRIRKIEFDQMVNNGLSSN